MGKDFGAYLDAQTKQAARGSSTEIQALRRKLDVTAIAVIHFLKVDPLKFQSKGRKGTIVLWYNGIHFNLLKCTIDEKLRPYARAGVDDIIRAEAKILVLCGRPVRQ